MYLNLVFESCGKFVALKKVFMAIGWLALLKVVPWLEVARKAPEIAENAKKLWGTVANKSPKSELVVVNEHAVLGSNDQEIGWLKQKLVVIESANAELRSQMLTSAELIKSLANQNAALVRKIEINRIRLLRLAAFTIIIGIIAIYCLAVTI